MTILEKSSLRKVKALRKLVDNGEYSPAYALEKLEDYHDIGKIIDYDYEELADYLESLLNEPEVEEMQEEVEPVEETKLSDEPLF